MANKDSILRYRITAENDQLKRDLAKAKGHLSRFKNQSRGISNSIKTQFAGMFGVFAAGAVFRDIGRTIAGFEKQMDKVAAITGATEKELSRLKDSAIELGRVSKFTASEMGQLQEEVARLGFSSRQIIDSTDAIRKLATVADSELGEAAKSLVGTMNSFNLEASQSEEIANIMAESFSKSALDLQKFTVSMSNVGATANAAGFNLAQTTSMIGILTNSNIDASKAGTDLRKIFTELSVQGITLESALNRIRKSSDKVKTAYEIFGQRASTSAIILAENADKVNELSKELQDGNKELNKMVGIMEDNLITDLQKLKSAWDGWILSLEDGSGVGTGVLRGLAKGFTDLLNGLSDFDAFTKGGGLKFLPGQSPDDKKALEEFNRIVQGVTFGDVSLETMKYSDALQTLDKRLNAFKQNKHYEKLISLSEDYKNKLKKINEEEQVNIARMNDKITAYKKQMAILSGMPSVVSKGAGLSLSPSNEDLGLGSLSGIGSLSNGSPDSPGGLYEQQLAAIRIKHQAFIEEMTMLNQQLASIITGTLDAAFNTIIDGIATGDLESAFNSLKSVFGQGLIEAGKALIGWGKVMEGIKAALKAGIFGGPAAFIAGGLAIAAGVALKASASRANAGITSGLGGSGSGGGSGRGSFANNISGQTISLDPKPINIKFENGSLTGMLEFENKRNKRTRAF